MGSNPTVSAKIPPAHLLELGAFHFNQIGECMSKPKSIRLCEHCADVPVSRRRFCSQDCIRANRAKTHVRKCKDCEKTPEEVEFGQHKGTIDGLAIVCKPCNRARTKKTTANYSAEKRAEITERFKSPKYRNNAMMRIFGIDLLSHEEMKIQQDNKCLICSETFTEAKVPHIDHNHETGKIRGLLCRTCNSGLGMFKDDPDKLRQAITYLKRTTQPAHIIQVGVLLNKRQGEQTCKLTDMRRVSFSEEGRLRLLESQGFMCACCSEDLSHLNFRMINIDHDHVGLFVRGALCKHCNVGLGLFYEDEVRFLAAVNYLVVHSAG